MANRGQDILGAVKQVLNVDADQVKQDLQTKFVQFYVEGIRAERQSVVHRLREQGHDDLADYFKEAKHVQEGAEFDYIRNIPIADVELEDEPAEAQAMGEADVVKADNNS